MGVILPHLSYRFQCQNYFFPQTCCGGVFSSVLLGNHRDCKSTRFTDPQRLVTPNQNRPVRSLDYHAPSSLHACILLSQLIQYAHGRSACTLRILITGTHMELEESKHDNENPGGHTQTIERQNVTVVHAKDARNSVILFGFSSRVCYYKGLCIV